MSSDQVSPKARPSRPTIAYYQGNGIMVTNWYLTTGPRRYETVEIAQLRQARGTTHPGVIVGLVTAVAEAAFVAPFVRVFDSALAWLVALLALAIPCVVGIFCAHRWPAQYELLADYRGRQVLLFTTRDRLEFGKVARSVQRAMDAAHRPS